MFHFNCKLEETDFLTSTASDHGNSGTNNLMGLVQWHKGLSK